MGEGLLCSWEGGNVTGRTHERERVVQYEEHFFQPRTINATTFLRILSSVATVSTWSWSIAKVTYSSSFLQCNSQFLDNNLFTTL
jgi:hypothetical protein